MSPLEMVLYKTHKTVLAACTELMIEYHYEIEIRLKQCDDCGIWLFPAQLVKDLDGSEICNDCVTAYGL